MPFWFEDNGLNEEALDMIAASALGTVLLVVAAIVIVWFVEGRPESEEVQGEEEQAELEAVAPVTFGPHIDGLSDGDRSIAFDKDDPGSVTTDTEELAVTESHKRATIMTLGAIQFLRGDIAALRAELKAHDTKPEWWKGKANVDDNKRQAERDKRQHGEEENEDKHGGDR